MPNTNPKSKIKNPKSLADVLLEIGTEELPAAYLPALIEQLGAEARALLAAHHLAFRQAESFGTPRRLVLFVRGLAAIQRKPGEEIRGPSRQAAFDATGKPTQALLGFLRSRGGTLGQVGVVSSAKGEHVVLRKPPTETPTAKLLPSLLPQLIGTLRAPKTMRWDATGLRFARPIRWVLALYGNSPIRCAIGDLTSASRTRIGRPQALREARVASIPGYFQTLTRAGILLDQAKRQRRIQQLVEREARRVGGVIAPEMLSHGLLEEVTHLVESPVLLAGACDPKYLELPREVLLASMAKYQRVFAIEGRGKILPTCVAVLEGKPGKPKAVQAVIERILNARLADSLLFWNKDREISLSKMDTSGITVHEKLGSMAQKTSRLLSLKEALVPMWKMTDEERDDLLNACKLAKFDLASSVVREFPTLQGIVGKYYALEEKVSPQVAMALEEQYLPSGNRMPKTLIGSALSILDKYDTLVTYFAIGIEPTGNEDPFGLRRAAQGVVEIAWAVHRPLSLGVLQTPYTSRGWFKTFNLADACQRVHRYLLERLYTFAWSSPAPSKDLIDAVVNSASDDLVDTMDRLQALRQMDGKQTLVRAAKVVERTHNILKSATVKQAEVDPARFQEPLERALWDRYQASRERFLELVSSRAYAEATAAYGEAFFEPLHDFFEHVMVNAPDEALQQNRLALMQAINTLYTGRIADLSKLAILQQ